MSNVIQFLEALGNNAEQLTHADYARKVALLDIGERQRKALMDRDQEALASLLGARSGMRCIIWSSSRAAA